MQTITTKYLPATNFKGSRIKAECERGSITVTYPCELSGESCHIYAVDKLIEKFVTEDKARFGTNRNPWSKPRAVGQMKDHRYAHVFIETPLQVA